MLKIQNLVYLTKLRFKYSVGLMNPTGPMPSVRRLALISDSIAAATGVEAEVPNML